MSWKQSLMCGHFVFAVESGLYLLKIMCQHNIKVIAFYETGSSLLHDLCYGFNHLFLFKIKINYIMPWIRISFYLVILLNSTLGQWWGLSVVHKNKLDQRTFPGGSVLSYPKVLQHRLHMKFMLKEKRTVDTKILSWSELIKKNNRASLVA